MVGLSGLDSNTAVSFKCSLERKAVEQRSTYATWPSTSAAAVSNGYSYLYFASIPHQRQEAAPRSRETDISPRKSQPRTFPPRAFAPSWHFLHLFWKPSYRRSRTFPLLLFLFPISSVYFPLSYFFHFSLFFPKSSWSAVSGVWGGETAEHLVFQYPA